MSVLIIQTNKNANLELKDDIIRIANLITEDFLEIPLLSNESLSIISTSEESKVYQISIKEDYPDFLLHGCNNLSIEDYGLYCAKRNNIGNFFISTKDFIENDFDGLPIVIKDEIMLNNRKGGFWINLNPVLQRLYLTGNEIITLCNRFDVQNSSRLINLSEYIFILLKNKKTFKYFSKKIPENMWRKPLLQKSVFLSINTIYLDNWPFIVQDSNSPTGYSLVCYSQSDFFDFSKLYYSFCERDNLFGNSHKYIPQLYAIGYDL